MTRIAALLSVALLVAACGTGTGTPALSADGGGPSAGVSAASSDGPTGSASAEPGATVAFSGATCELPAPALTVSLRGIHETTDAEVVMAAGAPSAPPEGPPDAGQFVGGHAYRVSISFDIQDATAVSVTPVGISSTLTVGGTAEPVAAKIADGGADITLPDGDGAAILTIVPTIESDSCAPLSPAAAFAIQRVPAATAAACPPDQDGSIALLQTLDTRLRIGSSVASFDNQAFEARYIAAAGSDSIPAFANYDPSASPVTVASASSVDVSAAGTDLSLEGADVQTWQRDEVVSAGGQLLPSPGDPIDRQVLTAVAGTARWDAPETPGRYVVAIFPTWTSDCLTGQGYLFISVTVT